MGKPIDLYFLIGFEIDRSLHPGRMKSKWQSAADKIRRWAPNIHKDNKGI